MGIEPEEFLGYAKQVLKLMGETSAFDIKLTAVFRDREVWKVNFSFSSTFGFKRNACFSVDDEDGEIKVMWLDRTW